MTYIVGTTLKISPPRQLRPGFTSSGISKPIPNYLPPGEYTLYHIKPSDGKFCYLFRDMNGNKHEVLFNSPKIADQFIADVNNELLPNYEEIYRKTS